MSVAEFSAPDHGFNISNESKQPALLSLDNIFKESMKKVKALYPAEVVVRCESLPPINGIVSHFEELFGCLITLILGTADNRSKLFLRIDCEEESGKTSPQNTLFKNHIIRFHTNFSTSDDWKVKHRDELSKCSEIILKYGGSFMVNNISNTGCLFFIMLPGKP